MPAVAAACDMLVALRDELAYSEEACRAQLAVALVRTFARCCVSSLRPATACSSRRQARTARTELRLAHRLWARRDAAQGTCGSVRDVANRGSTSTAHTARLFLLPR